MIELKDFQKFVSKKLYESYKYSVSADRLIRDFNFRIEGVDSITFLELIYACEKEYDVSIPDEDMSELDTVELLLNYINEKRTN